MWGKSHTLERLKKEGVRTDMFFSEVKSKMFNLYMLETLNYTSQHKLGQNLGLSKQKNKSAQNKKIPISVSLSILVQ